MKRADIEPVGGVRVEPTNKSPLEWKGIKTQIGIGGDADIFLHFTDAGGNDAYLTLDRRCHVLIKPKEGASTYGDDVTPWEALRLLTGVDAQEWIEVNSDRPRAPPEPVQGEGLSAREEALTATFQIKQKHSGAWRLIVTSPNGDCYEFDPQGERGQRVLRDAAAALAKVDEARPEGAEGVHPDTARLDWMDEHLRRDAQVVKDGRAVRTSHAWAIAGELDTLRETVDGVMKAESATGDGK
jgi:hypothetical protein